MFSAALPLCSVSRGFCKALLCDTFDGLLLKDPSQSVLESATEAFKWTLSISKTLNSHLLAKQELTSTQQDSGDNTQLTLYIVILPLNPLSLVHTGAYVALEPGFNRAFPDAT